MIFLRSLVFLIAQILITPPYAIFALATAPLAPLARFRLIAGWSHAMIWLAQKVLGIQYRVIGAENLPRTPAVILSKHQSAWETLAFQVIFPRSWAASASHKDSGSPSFRKARGCSPARRVGTILAERGLP